MVIPRPAPTGDPDAAITAAADDAPCDIATVALAFSERTRPGDSFSAARRHLAALATDLADELRDRGGPDLPIDRAAVALARVMAERHGYEGDARTYDDLANADLARVIERRRGLPVALGILYMHAARAQGWEAHGLDFPRHFLIRIGTGGGRAIVDPFARGHTHDAASLRALLVETGGPGAVLAPQHYAVVPDRAVLLRLQNNRKLRLVRLGRTEDALGVVDGMLLLAPDDSRLWYDSGRLAAHAGRLSQAVTALEQARELARTPDARQQATAALQALRGRLN